MKKLLSLLLFCASAASADTVYMFIGDGQSLSLGNYGTPAISTTQPYSNQGYNGAALAPLIETSQESPNSAAGNNVTLLDPAHAYSAIWINVGVGSQPVSALTCGTNNFTAAMAKVSAINSLVTGAGNNLVVVGVMWTHGEQDFNTASTTYVPDLVSMQSCMESTLKGITGQAQNIPWFLSQMNANEQAANTGVHGVPPYATTANLYACPDATVACIDDPTGLASPEVTIAQLRLQQLYPGKFILTGPKYQEMYVDAGFHLTNQGYNYLGATNARAIYQYITSAANQTGAVYPPIGGVTRRGNIVTVNFMTPRNLSLTLDTTLPPVLRNGVSDTVGKGFQFFQTGGGALTDTYNNGGITAVSCSGQACTITLSGTPTGTNQRLAYAFEGIRYTASPTLGTQQPGATHGNVRTVTDFTDLNGDPVQHFAVAFNEPVLSVIGPTTCQQGQICNYTATGGTPPLAYSLVSGSVGTIDPSTGAYTAPDHVVPRQAIGGCQALPNNNIFNTRIDNLPVHANNDLWMANIDYGINNIGNGNRINTVLSTDPGTPMYFTYNLVPTVPSPMIFAAFPNSVSQSGTAYTAPSWISGIDNHQITIYRDTCMDQEIYQGPYQKGANNQNASANSQSGILTPMESNGLVGAGTDAAGLPIAPLLYHQSELLDAAAGNLDAIQHATRLTLDALSIDTGGLVLWPAQTGTSGTNCQGPPVGGFVWTITGNGTTTVTTTTRHGFKKWPAGTTVTIDSVNYTVVSVSTPDTDPDQALHGFYLSMVLSSTISSGSHSMTTPQGNCVPYGARLRLKSSFAWPHVFSVTASGSTVTAATGDPFPSNWYNHGPDVTIDGVRYTVIGGLSDGTSITVSGTVPAGSHSLTGSNYYPGCSQACQNVVQAVIRQQQRYGVIVADVGSSWEADGDGGINSYDIALAASSLGCSPTGGCLFSGLIGNAANYEIVDESSLQTSQDQTTTDPTWLETKLANPYLTPKDAAVVQVTDANSATAFYSVSLQGVAIGIERPNEVVMPGASAFTLHPWVTGSTNKAYTCSLSPSGGQYGAITSGCLYSPPPVSAVPTSAITTTMVTVTATADSTVQKTIQIQIVPTGPDGKLYIALGKEVNQTSYTEGGITWWNDMAEGLSPALMPDDFSAYIGGTWSNYPSTTAYATAPYQTYSNVLSGRNDHHFRIHVANGSVTGTVLPANPTATSSAYPNAAGFSFDCNGTAVLGQTDLFTYTGATFVGRPLSCTPTIRDGLLHMVVRYQGVGPTNTSSAGGVYTYCAVPCYAPSNGSAGFVAGLVITPPAAVLPAMKRVTICASGCDYPATRTGLYSAMTDAADYQNGVTTGGACIPYIIEGTGTIAMNSNIYFPAKTCNQYVEIRSSQGAHFTPGQRYNPTTDDAYAFTLKITASGETISVSANTQYWRFRNVNFTTGAVVDGPGASYPVTSATWSGGTATATIGTNLSGIYAFAINGISPAGYNNGNIQPNSTTATTISYSVANNPGTYTKGGTVQVLYAYAISAILYWGDPYNGGDLNSMPHHLEIEQCAFRASGQGDAYTAIIAWGNDVTVADSYFSGFSHYGSDSYALNTYGTYLSLRNNYFSAVSEDFISGGAMVPAGMLPRFQYLTGNQWTKESWMNRTNGNGAPNRACFAGNIYHDDAANLDYLCSGTGTGTWTVQSTLSAYGVGPYPWQYPKNIIECKMCQGVRLKGNDISGCPAQSSQVCTAVFYSEVTQLYVPSSGTCPDGFPQPCVNQPQPWTVISDVAVHDNNIHNTLLPFAMGGAVFTTEAYQQLNFGGSIWTATGDGADAVITSTGRYFPAGIGGNGKTSLLVDGITYAVLQPVSFQTPRITLCVASYTATGVCGSVVMAAGPHNVVMPSYALGHNHFRVVNNLMTNSSDERNYCTAYNPYDSSQTYCTISPACSPSGGQSCGGVGFLNLSSGSFDNLFDHNTMTTSIATAGSGLMYSAGSTGQGSADFSGLLTIRNNIFPAGVDGFRGVGTAIPQNGCGLEAVLTPNNGALVLNKNIVYGGSPTGQTWQSFSTGSVTPACAAATSSSIWPTDHAGGSPWTTYLDSTTFKAKGSYVGWGSDGRDPGADINVVNWMTAHAVDGAPAPALDYTIRTVIPTSNGSAGRGIRIYFTAPSTNACSLELSKDPNVYASPIAVSSQVRTGRDGLAVWNNGTLTAGTAYWVRLTCDGNQLESFVNGDRAYGITAP